MRRSPSVSLLVVAAAVTLGACSRNAMQLNVAQHPADRALLLSCARSVASNRGLGEITPTADSLELQARSAVAVEQGAAPSYDLLTVKLSPAKQGLRMLVGSTSYVLRQLRAGGVGTAAARSEWVGTQPSERVALVRDAVLEQCGTIGH